jgi:hypothetical protein
LNIRTAGYIISVAAILAGVSAFAQSAPMQPRQTNVPTIAQPLNGAAKQRKQDGNGPPINAAADGAFKQPTQSIRP